MLLRFGLKKLPEKTRVSVGIKSLFGLTPLKPKAAKPPLEMKFSYTDPSAESYAGGPYISFAVPKSLALKRIVDFSISPGTGAKGIAQDPWEIGRDWDGAYFIDMRWEANVITGETDVYILWHVALGPTTFTVVVIWDDGQSGEIVQTYKLTFGTGGE